MGDKPWFKVIRSIVEVVGWIVVVFFAIAVVSCAMMDL